MTQDSQGRTRKSLLVNLLWFAALVVPVVYVLSYAPAARWFGANHVIWDDGRYHKFYEPVDWLIYNTPLRTPLGLWAQAWGVADEFMRGQVQSPWDSLDSSSSP